MDNPFAKELFGRVALKKVGEVDPNFRFYECGWMEAGHPSTWDTMELRGAVFREATRGPRKGKLCIPIPGTKRTVYVTRAEMDQLEREDAAAAKPKYTCERNLCQCHPETCSCGAYRVLNPDGTLLACVDNGPEMVKKLNQE